MKQTKNITGMDFFYLSLYAFAAIGSELILAFLEPFIYGHAAEPADWTIISHWIIICIIWGACAFWLLKIAVKKYHFEIHSHKSIQPWQSLAVIALLVLSLIISYISWGGFKVWLEFSKLGLLNFIFQYIYYFFESVLLTLIIVFAQKAFEIWFKHKNLPYGGILCGITWGSAHIFTKSSLEIGLLTVILGFGLGALYLLLNRDLRKTILFVFLMFIL